jgi:hypothetical protein
MLDNAVSIVKSGRTMRAVVGRPGERPGLDKCRSALSTFG